MPSAQIVNFGEDPYANAMGGFAKNFLTTLNEKTGQRRNEDIFKKISDNYGKDADIEDIYRDVLKAEGFDQEYKRNKLNEIKDYATLANKSKLNGYEQSKLEQRRDELLVRQDANRIAESRLTNEANKVEANLTKNKAALSKQINDYSSKLLKDSELDLPLHDKSDLNEFIEQLVSDKENPKSMSEAFNHAAEYIQARREKIDSLEMPARPSSWAGFANPSPKDLEQGMEQAYLVLKALHDEDGVTSQKELRKIAKKGGWNDEEITQILQKIFQEAGKKLRGPSPQSSAQIPFQQQGKASQAAGIDDILFGE